MTPMLTVNREELLKFFDDRSDCSKGHATSVVAVVGEDLTRKFHQGDRKGCFQWHNGCAINRLGHTRRKRP